MRITILFVPMLLAGCHAASPPPPAAPSSGDSAHRGMMMHGGRGMSGMHADSTRRGMMMHGAMPARPGTHGEAEAGGEHGDAAGEALQCPAGTPAMVEQGRELFAGRGNCIACHGADARGTPMAPNLTDAEWLHGDGSYPWLAQIIATGVARPLRHPAPMPARGGASLSAAEVCALAAYVRSRGAP